MNYAAYRKTFGWGLMFLAFVALTNRTASLETDRTLIAAAASDSYSYLALASAAPGLTQTPMAFQHGQRLAVPYAIGIAAKVTGVPVHTWFRIGVALLALGIVASLSSTLEKLSIGVWQSRIILALFVFNPWAVRLDLTFPELINDIGFVFGLALLIRGLVSGASWPVLVGQLIASLCRQTGVLLIPMAVLWIVTGKGEWTGSSKKRRASLSVALTLIAVAVYVGTAAIARHYSFPDTNLWYALDGIHWLLNDFEFRRAGELLAFLFISPALVLVLFAISSWRGIKPHSRDIVSLLLLGSVTIWAQLLVSGPYSVGRNGERLATLGLFPLLVALGVALRDSGIFADGARKRDAVLVLVFLAVTSLHHLYTAQWVSLSGQRQVFVLLYVAGTIAIGLLTLAQSKLRNSGTT